jgi:hypothetical protein
MSIACGVGSKFGQATANFYKNLIITLVFEKNAIFLLKLAKIAVNCDHNFGTSLIYFFLQEFFPFELHLGHDRGPRLGRVRTGPESSQYF